MFTELFSLGQFIGNSLQPGRAIFHPSSGKGDHAKPMTGHPHPEGFNRIFGWNYTGLQSFI